MSTDRITAALQEYYLAWIEEHGVDGPPGADARILEALAAAPRPEPRYYGADAADTKG